MEGQLLPAQAQPHAASNTAMENADTAPTAMTARRRARGESRTGKRIARVGGVTAMIGDPSGKRAERPMLALEAIDRNAAAIGRQLERFLTFEGPAAARLCDNAAWLRQLPLVDFLRDAGKHFTLGYML